MSLRPWMPPLQRTTNYPPPVEGFTPLILSQLVAYRLTPNLNVSTRG